MSIEGITLDYGPFGFMEEYDPNFTANYYGDETGRYSYVNQPSMVLFNLVRLANAIFSLNPNP